MGLVQYTSLGFRQIYTKCTNNSMYGDPMSAIAVTKAEFEASERDAQVIPCSDANGSTYYRQNISSGAYLQKVTKCAVQNITLGDIRDSHSSMWAQDGSGLTTVPIPNLQRHAWNYNSFWLIFAIHNKLPDDEIIWGKCPPSSSPGTGIYPCQVFDGTMPPNGWCIPARSKAMDTWLTQIAEAKLPAPKAKAKGLTVVYIGIGIAAILLVSLLYFWCRKKSKLNQGNKPFPLQGEPNKMIASSTGTGTFKTTKSWQPFSTTSNTLNEFQEDLVLNSKRVPYSSVDRTRQISKGAFGEVWLGTCEGQIIAIKCLIESRRSSQAEIENFAEEIRLMASFSHPNIVQFIAFAWDNLQHLCFMTEYMANGDLMSFLDKNVQLTWSEHEKIKIARGIANGLAYLHGHNPKIIHRDLKSKNVLMAQNCVAKLTDFGISRERQDDTMTAGIGTFFWTAPEVLTGVHYNEKADIYSFGCVLVEMDTRKSPFHDMKGAPQPLMIQRITKGGLRPKLSEKRPAWLQTLFQELQRNKITDNVDDSTLTPAQSIIKQLSRFNLKWNDLDKLMKQALLWDMGFVRYSPDDVSGLAQVYTKCVSGSSNGQHMSTIVLKKSDYEALYPKGQSPTMIECTANGITYYRQSSPNGDYLQSYANCAIFNLGNIRDSLSSMWAQDANELKSAPTPRIYRHIWEEKLTRSIFAIHTQLHDNEIGVAQCPLNNNPGTGIFPCRAFDRFNNSDAPDGFCPPDISPRMEDWLKKFATNNGVKPPSTDTTDNKTSTSSSLSAGAIVGIVIGVIVVLGLALFLFLKRRNKAPSKQEEDFYYEQNTNDECRDTSNGTTTAIATLQNNQRIQSERAESINIERPLDTSWQLFHPSSHMLNEFQRDPVLNKRRVPASHIDKTRQISKGAFGEIWLGLYIGQVVAIKCLFESKRASEPEIEKFAEEIRLMASFSHPNIVQFIAFAWDELENLCAVIEYMPNGDLESFLMKNMHLTWRENELIKIARGIADGLAYLHGLDPKVIHRDLKAKNVLMGKNCVAKLTDFGISRESYDDTLTAAVGTFYWTAPEVLIGGHYSEKADIYSFGCVLVEMDTRLSPFHDMKSVSRPLMIKHVTEEGLHPLLSDDSPPWLQTLASYCFHPDPSQRPSAEEVSDKWLESSDLVAKFQELKKSNLAANVIASPLVPPTSVTTHLNSFKLKWSDLDNVAKQALLWDMGFVKYASDTEQITQVYTKCANGATLGQPMSTIAMPVATYNASQKGDQRVRLCKSDDGSSYFRQENADGSFLKNLTSCAVRNVTAPNSHSSMWAQDGSGLTAVPTPQLGRHAWNDGKYWEIYSIHTQLPEGEIIWGQCPASSTPGTGIFPCRVIDKDVPLPSGWCLPAPSAKMDAWLNDIKLTTAAPTTASPAANQSTNTSSNSLSTGAIIGIVIGAVVLIAFVLCLFMWRRKRQAETEDTFYVPFPTEDGYNKTNNSNHTGTRTGTGTGTGNWQQFHTASATLNDFQRDPILNSKRVPYSSVDRARQISKGAFGEVWLGSCNGQVVAVKRLLESKRTSEAEIESFAEEIRLMASFSHPNIVQFVAFAWDNLQNLCAVIEFMENGDLMSYLNKNVQLSWNANEKTKIAHGIANGLAYLHGHEPKIIHRDLKSKNVLMGEDCVAKLTDFGISRENHDETMTAGVGTFFWTAPEVLMGGHYTEKADIYSFGCILIEMDTRKSPFHDMKGVPQPLMIQRITMEGLRPTLSESSPTWLTSLAIRCFEVDPFKRPSAEEISKYLLDSSDLVNKFQALKKAKITSNVSESPSVPSVAINTRLTKYSLKWTDLDSMDKQALLWDMGFVRYSTSNPDAVRQVYTKCANGSTSGVPMSAIALTKSEFLASQVDASSQPCAAADGTTYARQVNANGLYLGPVTKCAVQNITLGEIADSHSSMWAQDGSGLTAVPNPNLLRHAWNDKFFWLIFAIHTETLATEIGWSQCPPSNSPGSGTYPCRVFDGDTPPSGWCIPANSPTMDAWLTQLAQTKVTTTAPTSSGSTTPSSQSSSTSNSLSTGAIIGIAVGAVVLLVLILCLFLWCRKKLRENQPHYVEFASNNGGHNTNTTITGTATNYKKTNTSSWQPIHTASHTLNEFQRDPALNMKRVPYSSIDRTRQISKGAFGEVWLGSYGGQVVAVKRLLESKRASEAEIENFTEEIRLMASFSHPNIVQFIAFAWDSLQNLSAVTEYMPNGDLVSFLNRNVQLTWNEKEKIKIARGIANGLAYLHAHIPKIIHRDLKAKNVLMGQDCVAKLTDFGISRENHDETMTAGVGTFFWTAPEVLTGGHYTEKADIYSFGCVMIEMDSHRSPFYEMKKVPQAMMIHRITQEGLRPSLTPNSPPWLQTLVVRCFERDPSRRPSAAQLSDFLSQVLLINNKSLKQ
ncbi:kinase [Thraustotheca clavata]|uniref:Kinase n=1 Tax=Thraustotheca clavata TaxID=74557 RepID=A0A1W0A3Z7_9STRA|nr:kinase [Thraustotheca clavata]